MPSFFGSRARGSSTPASDVEVAIRFPPDFGAETRFRKRNRLDAELQSYADAFVHVSDVESLPLEIQYRALREGIVLVGDPETVEEYRDRIERKYERTAPERERAQREFIDRLARVEP
ncbi:MAG: nucleotidyltransferase family protein [Halanaeroarchaeum sp.]